MGTVGFGGNPDSPENSTQFQLYEKGLRVRVKTLVDHFLNICNNKPFSRIGAFGMVELPGNLDKKLFI